MIHRIAVAVLFISCLAIDKAYAAETPEPLCPAPEVRFMLLDPGRAHAAMLRQELFDGVSLYIDVYAALDSDLLDYLDGVRRLNARATNPAALRLEVHASPDSLTRMLEERPGNVVVLSGRNRDRIHAIRAAVEAGFSVLADDPWIIRAEDLPSLEAVLIEADRRGLVACDTATARYEITTMLLRELAGDKDVFGRILTGSAGDPSVVMESVGSIRQFAKGTPRARRAWFFDVEQQGEGLADVGARLIDLIPWLLFPEKSIDAQKDVRILDARRWPTIVPRAVFRSAAGVGGFPGFLKRHVSGDSLEYFCNGRVSFVLRGVHALVTVSRGMEALPGDGDGGHTILKGSRARIEVRAGEAEGFRRELYVVPNQAKDKARVLIALRKRLDGSYPEMDLDAQGGEIRVKIPAALRADHEAYSAEATKRFLRYLRDRAAMPAWEKASILTKHFVTTKAIELSRRGPSEAPEPWTR